MDILLSPSALKLVAAVDPLRTFASQCRPIPPVPDFGPNRILNWRCVIRMSTADTLRLLHLDRIMYGSNNGRKPLHERGI